MMSCQDVASWWISVSNLGYKHWCWSVRVTALVTWLTSSGHTDADCRELDVKHCTVSPKSSRQCPGWRGQTSGSSRSFLPSDSRLPLCSDEVCVCSQVHTVETWVDCVFVVVCAPRHSPCCTWAVCWWFSNIEKWDNMRDECSSVQFWEGERWLLREGWEHAEVSKVLDVVVGCSLGGISSHG